MLCIQNETCNMSGADKVSMDTSKHWGKASCCILDEQPQDILVQGCIHISMLPPFFHVATTTQKTSPSFQHLAYQSLNLVYLSNMLNKCAKGMP